MNDFPIRVTAEILPGKVDPSATAGFNNCDRATQYALMLAATDDYNTGGVFITDARGLRRRIGYAPPIVVAAEDENRQHHANAQQERT